MQCHVDCQAVGVTPESVGYNFAVECCCPLQVMCMHLYTSLCAHVFACVCVRVRLCKFFP